MEYRELNVEVRERTGKGACRQLRMKEMVPGIVYGKGIEPVPVAVNPKQVAAAIAGEGGQNHLITLRGGGALDGSTIIVADILRDPLKGTLRHVDFHRVNMAEKVRVDVPVKLVGTAAGVRDGGMLDYAMHTIEVECLPNQIPEHIDVDVTALGIGHSIHVGDIQVPEGLRVISDSKASVVSILGKAKEETPAAAE